MLKKYYFPLFAALLHLVLTGCTESTTGTKVTGADPGVLEAPIAFVKRPIALDDNGDELQSDLRDPLFFVAGGDVYLRSNSTVIAVEKNITSSVTGGQGDVKGLRPSFDGTKLLFSLRLFDDDPNDDVIPSWNIYEYDLTTEALRRIIGPDLTAEEGDDLSPAYLPDGRIVFSSNRQVQAVEMLINEEGKPPFRALDEAEDTLAMVLHVMSENGGDIHQISFNQSHDLDPTVLTHNYSGEVMFTRWDNAGSNSSMNLYKMTPDGTRLEVLYGVHSHDTGANNSDSDDTTIQFTQAQEMEDGSIIAIARPFTNTFDGGDIVVINAQNFANIFQPVAGMSSPGPAQRSATINPVSTETTDNELSLGGRYRSVFPLWDGSGRIMFSKSTCELNVSGTRRPCIEPYVSDATAEEVSPAYSIWLYDMNQHSQKVLVRAEQGIAFSDIVALQARENPDIILDKVDTDLIAPSDLGVAVLHIKSVYDFGNASFNGCFLTECTSATGITSVNDLGDPLKATADERPARFVRFVKPVSLPDPDGLDLADPPDLDRAAFGPQRNQAMREIVGYAPVEPDGSVKVRLPADISLAVEVLDKMGRRIGPRHQNWFQLRPGDTMECTGCHTANTSNNAVPNIHHRRDAEAASINTGIPASGVFENTLIPGSSDKYSGNPGETMAEVRFAHAPSKPEVTTDIVYNDYWTDPALNTPFSFEYGLLDSTISSPARSTCTPWTYKCRIVINYEQHIHPLWSLSRGVVSTPGELGDDTCIRCHSNKDAMVDKVPDAQLDLTDGASDIEQLHYKSYDELLVADAGQELDATNSLVNIQIEVPILDENGEQVIINDIPQTEFIDDPNARVSPTMSANGARASYFIEKMTETELNARRSLTQTDNPNFVDHSGFMDAHELRLISEWLDLGAQYFNDPFDPAVPMN